MSGTNAILLDTLQIKQQCVDNWCWAEVTIAILKYYNPTTSATACGLASQAYHTAGRPPLNCCVKPVPGVCDTPYHLRDSLTNFANQNKGQCREAPTDCTLSEIEIREQLAAGCPICVRVSWTAEAAGSAGHVFIIRGISQDPAGEVIVAVADPAQLYFSIALSDLNAEGYPPAGGKVDGIYYTKRAS